ncbi:MAG: hypothetical protein PPP58_09890 [Natronomonas sp.]
MHEVTAAYGAAAIGGVGSALVGAVWLVNRRLEDDFDLRHREAAAVAGTSFLVAGLFAVMGAEALAAATNGSHLRLIGLSLLGVSLWTLSASLLLIKPVRWYIEWARRPAVLREYDGEGH